MKTVQITRAGRCTPSELLFVHDQSSTRRLHSILTQRLPFQISRPTYTTSVKMRDHNFRHFIILNIIYLLLFFIYLMFHNISNSYQEHNATNRQQ